MPKFKENDIVISRLDNKTIRTILAIRHLEHVYLIHFPELKHCEYWPFKMTEDNFRHLTPIEKLLYG